MSTAMKLALTTIIVALVAILTLWSGSPVRADQLWLLIAIAAGSIVMMWTFPKAGF